MTKLSNISIYPVKSLRGYDISSARVERMGLENDRRLMVVDPQGQFLTQREHAHMALIKTVIEGDWLSLNAPGMDPFLCTIRTLGPRQEVEIWSSSGVASIDQGEDAAEWLSTFLNMPARLVRMANDYQRQVSGDYAVKPDDHVSFADGFPILITSQSSLDDLNQRLENPIPMNRFRTNLVVSECQPYEEDTWKRIRIGEVELALVKPCARCNVPTIDQETAESGKEPSATLARYRKINGKIMFGVNVIPLTTGNIHIGQELEILE